MIDSNNNTTINSTNRCSFTTGTSAPTDYAQQFPKSNEIYLHSEPGNITPHFWFKKVVDKKGNSDHTAIILLSDIYALFRFSVTSPSSSFHSNHSLTENIFENGTLRTSYDYFAKKFLIRKEKARRAFMRLEELNIISRDVCNISLEEGGRCNKLMLTLNQEFFLSCFRNPALDIRVEKNELTLNQTSFKNIENENIDNIKEKELASSGSNEIQSLQISYHPISNKNKKNIIKDRSMKSKFLQNSFFKKENEDSLIQYPHTHAPVQLKTPIKQLKDFYPLTEADAKSLQSSSGREFSLNAMNEILLDMSKRVKDRWFKSKKRFLSYMGIVFKHEMRDAVRINNENFRIKANLTSEDIIARKQEEYLKEIEYNLHISPEWHLKKKIASALEREKAYNLLTSYRDSHMEGGVFKIYLTKQVELTDMDRQNILNLVKASHDKISLSSLEGVGANKLEIIMPKKNLNPIILKPKGQGSNSASSNKKTELVGMWGKIRKELITYFGKDGEPFDTNWFSKLEVKEDEQTKEIALSAPSRFYRDWIQQNYMKVIEQKAEEYQCKLTFC